MNASQKLEGFATSGFFGRIGEDDFIPVDVYNEGYSKVKLSVRMGLVLIF